eukprot:tig00000194_g14818.t1
MASLFDVYFLFCSPIAFFALGSWFLLAPWWAENFVTPGLDEKVYIGDPLNELNVQLYGIALVSVVALLYISLRRAVSAGDGRTAGLLLGLISAGSALVTVVAYGLFHHKYNPPFAFGPALFLFMHVLTLLLSAFFGWRYWSGQAPVQPQAPAKRPWDIFTVVFLVAKPALWMLVKLVALLWPVEYAKFAMPGFVGTAAEPLYTLAPTVLFVRLAAVLIIAVNACVLVGGWRADQATLRRIFAAVIATVVSVAWAYGDFARRYAAVSLASAPALLLASFSLEILSNAFALFFFLGGPVAASPAPAPAPGPYGYASQF